ncbi:hypothetical protein [Terriglobus aquaticus]|uniref:Tetratricopeptide repeat-containing protein n=1 Tax=Terriglobus aquaticus TaxID=940139 RepID=A0ABW9KNV5_9BACT|nr:hypothetical protein [Terriglobus aquaticus]
MIEQFKSLLHRARHLRQSGEAAEAERLFKEAAAQAEAHEACERAEALVGVAQARRDAGDRTGAAIYYAEAITLFRTANNTTELAHALRHAAEVRSEMKEYGVAGTQIEEAIRLYRSTEVESESLDLANALRVSALNNERQAHSQWLEAKLLYASQNVTDGVREAEEHLEGLKHHEQYSKSLNIHHGEHTA